MPLPEPMPLPEGTNDPNGKSCQEASPFAYGFYIPCGKPATHVVETDPGKRYPMCHPCAHHNVRNRRGILHYGEL